MTEKKAFKLAGFSERPKNKAEWASASETLKALIVAARRAADDKRAAALSEARQLIKKRVIANACEVCGITINPGASHCATHRGATTLKIGGQPNKTRLARKGGKTREFPSVLAESGYWSMPVRRVVVKWKDQIGEDWCQYYILSAFRSVFYSSSIAVLVANDIHKGYVIELLGALYSLATLPKYRLEKELLMSAGLGSADYAAEGVRPYPDRYPELLKRINRTTDEPFSYDDLKQTMGRLRLNDVSAPNMPPARCAEIITAMHGDKIGR